MAVWFIAGVLSGGLLVGVAFACLSAGSYNKGYLDAMVDTARERPPNDE